jgi:hypothetical protein
MDGQIAMMNMWDKLRRGGAGVQEGGEESACARY